MISIIVAVYNIQDYIGYCIESILRQSLMDWELLLINDGSTDGSRSICELYAIKDKRIKVINKNNGGLSSARNAGINSAFGQWIMFVDGDDYLLPDTLKNLHNCIEQAGDDVDFIQYGFQEADNYEGKFLKTEFLPAMDFISDWHEMFYRLLVMGGEAASMCTKLIRRDILKRLKFQEGIIHEDEQFTTHLLLESRKVAYSRYKPYIYVRRNNSIITSRFSKKRLDIIGIMNERFALMEKYSLQRRLVSLFRIKHIKGLRNLYMAALEVNDKESAVVLNEEYVSQIKLLDFSLMEIPVKEKIRLILAEAGFPVLKIESIVRKSIKKVK